jgi:hypothetical protein
MTVLALVLLLATTIVRPAHADGREVVRFARGASSATVEATITGHETRDYVLGARAGQTLKVTLWTKGTLYFNVLAPASTGQAIFNGATAADWYSWSGTLPATGDYVVRVYAMGAARDQRETQGFTCTFSIE